MRAVIGIDFYLSYFFDDIDEIRILETGFAAIISNGGAVISDVELWDTGPDLYRVFEEKLTGLNLNDWHEIRDEDRDLDETWSFNVPKTHEQYHCIRYYIRDSYDRILYTILLSVSDDEIVEIIEDLKENFDAIHAIVFYI